MTEPVRTVEPDLTVREAARYLAEDHIGSIVVEGEPPGLVTKTDVVTGVRDGVDHGETTVASLMSSPVTTVGVDADLGEAIDRMETDGLRRLPVADDGRVVGIVTTTDLLSALAADSRTVAGALARGYDLDRPHTYECVACGYRESAERHPETCPECGGRLRNLSVARE
jgi:signal-transduction protein with cAMP-binding, CBS, and nucleotidyltransferase domain